MFYRYIHRKAFIMDILITILHMIIGITIILCFVYLNNKFADRNKRSINYIIRFNLINGKSIDANVIADCEFNNVKSLIYVSNLVDEKRNKYIIKESGNEKYVFKNELRSIELIKERDIENEAINK